MRRPLFACCVSLLANIGRADDIDDAIQAVLQEHKLKAAAVVFYDEVNYDEPIVRALGVKNCDGDPVDVDTAFMLASASKTFVGLATAIAIDKGIIEGLDAKVDDILPYKLQHPDYKDTPVTVRHLLTHRSGLVTGVPAPYEEGPEWGYAPPPFGVNPSCPLDQLAEFYNDLLVDRASVTKYGNVDNWFEADADGVWDWCCEPGQCHEYSNLGTGLMGAVIAEASGMPFEDFCREYIFNKADFSNTAWFTKNLDQPSNQARPFDFDGTNYKCQDVYCFVDYPSGSLRTSARDLAKYLELMVNGGADLVSEAQFTAMTKCIEQDEKGAAVTGDSCQNGYYWFMLDEFDFGYLAPRFGDWASIRDSGIRHDGAENGVQSELLVLKKAKVAVGFVTNTNSQEGYDDFDSAAVLEDLVKVMPSSYTSRSGDAIGDSTGDATNDATGDANEGKDDDSTASDTESPTIADSEYSGSGSAAKPISPALLAVLVVASAT